MKKIVYLVLFATLIFSCSSPASNQLTSTPLSTSTFQPTSTSKPTSTPLPATAIPLAYIIPAGTFPLDTKENCSTDANIVGIDKTGFTTQGGILSMRNGAWVLWCPGAKHTWMGTLSYKGYTFSSNSSTPLRFWVDSQGEYQYISGMGTITQPDGKLVTLPLTEVLPTATFSTVGTPPVVANSTTVLVNGVDPEKLLKSNGFIFAGGAEVGGCASTCSDYVNKSMGLSVDVYADRQMIFAVTYSKEVDASTQSKLTYDLIHSIYGSEMNTWINDNNAAVQKGSPQAGIVGNFTTYMEFYKDLNLLVIVISPA